MKYKKITAALLTLAMALSLAACNSTSEKKESEEEKAPEGPSFVSFDDADTLSYIKSKIKEEAADGEIAIRLWCAGDDRAFEKNLCDEFIKKFSQEGAQIKITIVSKGEDEAGTKLVEMPSKGADVLSFGDEQLTLICENDAIAKVDDFYKDRVIEDNSEDSVTVSTMDGTLFGFPKTCDYGYFLYYDKRYLTEEDVKTFDGMIEKAASQGKSVYFNMANAWYNTGFFFTAGCDIRYENGTQTADFDSPEGLSAARAMAHICEKQGQGFIGAVYDSETYPAFWFEDGTVIAEVIGTWEEIAIKRAIGAENVGVAKLPTVLMDGEQKQLHSFGGYKLTGVNAFSSAPFTSQTLAYYLTCEENQLARYETKGLLPTNKKTAENEKVKDDPAFKAIEDQRPYSHPQCTTVSSIYWNCGIGNLGRDIYKAKGNIDDATLQSKLKACEDKCSAGKFDRQM